MLAVYRVWGVRLPVSTFVRSITICVLAYIWASKWQTPGLLLLLKLPVISMVIIITITLLGECSKDEIAFVRSLFGWRSKMKQNKEKVK
jgi:hypothetical protein